MSRRGKTDEMDWLEEAETKLQEQRIVNGICKSTIEATIAHMEANPPDFYGQGSTAGREYYIALERLRATFDLLA
jgi:hypothetical protein